MVGYATNYKVLFMAVNSPKLTKKGEKNMGSVSDIPYEKQKWHPIILYKFKKHHHVIQKSILKEKTSLQTIQAPPHLLTFPPFLDSLLPPCDILQILLYLLHVFSSLLLSFFSSLHCPSFFFCWLDPAPKVNPGFAQITSFEVGSSGYQPPSGTSLGEISQKTPPDP